MGYNLEKPKGRRTATFGVLLTFVLTVVLFGGALYLWYLGLDVVGPTPGPTHPQRMTDQDGGRVEPFVSEADFSDWLSKADSLGGFGMPLSVMSGREMMVAEDAAVMAPNAAPTMGLGEKSQSGIGGGVSAGRMSETNVQVAGIDEPDILKTDGREIYYAPQGSYYRGGITPMMGAPEVISFEEGFAMKDAPEVISFEEGIPNRYFQPGVKAVRAFPPEDLSLDAEIDLNGDLLLDGDVLAVLSYDGIHAYGVDDPKSPSEAWKLSYEDNSWPVESRLKDGKLFLVLAHSINRGRPCPFVPAVSADGNVSIGCGDIWHPVSPVPSDVTYTVMKVDFASGKVERTASFVAAQGSSVVYMSEGSIYVTHVLPADAFSFVFGFLGANADIVPALVLERLNQVSGYELSEESKASEMRSILGRWFETLDEDDALALMNEIDNRIGDYLGEHRRELQQTGIVRIDTGKLDVKATGSVPGVPLNQFSLDEHKGYLRVATTSGETGGLFWQFGFGGGRNDSINDLYVLDASLSLVGEALGMGQGERIYAVRFVGEQGYVVTFRQTDPFYVLDLSKPRKPEIRGELKIPGYSSYLHPLKEGRILGVGQDDGRVKLSLFDVSDPAAPAELDRYSLSEYWSDVLDTHHAFLLDGEHEMFFLPGGDGGYVLSYSGDSLKLVKAVSGIRARRAVYLDSYLYVAGDDKIVVLDMSDWRRVNQLKF
ncbi:MAG: beta-propeller domain-containing protein [bacterium]